MGADAIKNVKPRCWGRPERFARVDGKSARKSTIEGILHERVRAIRARATQKYQFSANEQHLAFREPDHLNGQDKHFDS